MERYIILIYSQQRLLTTLLAAIIEDRCLQTICSNSLSHAKEVCQHTKPALVIILDTAPCMNGENLIQYIRQFNQHRPAIYVIAWQQTEYTVLSLLECGIDQYFTFPICIARLRYKIAALGESK